MRLCAIVVLCIEIFAGLRVAGNRCNDGKCPSVSQNGSEKDGKESDDRFTCCACGGATYDITFTGKWTESTYPRHFPGRMARWSPLIGSSHSKDYIVWQFGGMASPGVTKVSEWGAVEMLEKEMKNQGEKVLSIIKTHTLYRSAGKVSTTFKADSKRNLVSALAKIFPSPDWNVGVDRINLCDGNCTWKKAVIRKLYPWDAGTDDGKTFKSPNIKSVPQQPIRNITTNTHKLGSFPGQGDRGVTQPFGQIEIQLMQTSGECNGKPGRPPFPEKSPKVHCKVSRWSEWRPCSVTCGTGVQRRGRAVIQKPKNDGIPCPQLIESRACIQPTCIGKLVIPAKPVNCKLSPWSSWSECRGSCNRGGQFRSRKILQKAEHGGSPCPEFKSLIKWRRCKLTKCPPEKHNDCIVTGWSPWSECTKKCNRGKKLRVRKIIRSEKNGGASCPKKLRERKKCVPVKCPV